MDGPVLAAIRMRQLGDVLATLGALRALKASRPERRVVYVVDAAYHALLEPLEFIDVLLPSPPRVTGPKAMGAFAAWVGRLRAMRPETVLDFHGSARTALVAALSGAPRRIGFDVRVRRVAYTAVEPRAVTVDGVVVPRTSAQSALALASHAGAGPATDALPELPVAPGAVDEARRRLAAAGVPERALADGRVVGLNPGRPYPAKAWSHASFVVLARRLVEHRRRVVILWGPGEEPAARALADDAGAGTVTAPATALAELPALLRALGLVVTIDSGLKHVAVCARVPTVTLFGPTNPGEWHMGTDADRVLWKGLSCSPCRRRECPFGAPCMEFVPDEVLDVAERAGAGRTP